MLLILSSRDFRNENSRRCIIEHLNKPIDQCRVLFFPNEKASSRQIQNGKYHVWMQQRGFQRENIHVFNYYSPDGFDTLDIDCLYISGGNTFQMMDRIRRSHADELIVEYIQRGVTYIGGSAGVHIVSSSIAHLLPIDGNPTGISDVSGLGLFPGILFCHYGEARRVYYEQAVAEGRFPVYALTDEQSLVFDGEVHIFSAEGETLL